MTIKMRRGVTYHIERIPDSMWEIRNGAPVPAVSMLHHFQNQKTVSLGVDLHSIAINRADVVVAQYSLNGKVGFQPKTERHV